MSTGKWKSGDTILYSCKHKFKIVTRGTHSFGGKSWSVGALNNNLVYGSEFQRGSPIDTHSILIARKLT